MAELLEFDECDCRCHIDPLRLAEPDHVAPCCAACQYCHKNIRLDVYEEHEKDCRNPDTMKGIGFGV